MRAISKSNKWSCVDKRQIGKETKRERKKGRRRRRRRRGERERERERENTTLKGCWGILQWPQILRSNQQIRPCESASRICGWDLLVRSQLSCRVGRANTAKQTFCTFRNCNITLVVRRILSFRINSERETDVHTTNIRQLLRSFRTFNINLDIKIIMDFEILSNGFVYTFKYELLKMHFQQLAMKVLKE